MNLPTLRVQADHMKLEWAGPPTTLAPFWNSVIEKSITFIREINLQMKVKPTAYLYDEKREFYEHLTCDDFGLWF